MNRYYRSGIFTAFLLGAVYAWRNRYEIQRYLESKGIKTPIDTSTLGSTVRSGLAKIKGLTERAA
jgi:hypothetical protein